MTIQAVVFDIGETLLDDSREFGAWADWLGVPRHTFSAVLGAVTAERREDAGSGEQYGEEDLYPDVRPALSRLREMGLWVGIAGNQTARAGHILRGLDLPADLVATSAEWGAAKPDPAFFAHVIEVSPGEPHEIVYVGDHRDNDLEPAKAAGLRTAFVRRGPWGYLWAQDPKVHTLADWHVDSLTELPALLQAVRAP